MAKSMMASPLVRSVIAGVVLANVLHMAVFMAPQARASWSWSQPRPRPQPAPSPSPNPTPGSQTQQRNDPPPEEAAASAAQSILPRPALYLLALSLVLLDAPGKLLRRLAADTGANTPVAAPTTLSHRL